MNSRWSCESVDSSISLAMAPATRSPKVTALESCRSTGASSENSVDVIRRAARTFSTVSLSTFAVSASVGVRPSSWARMVSIRPIRTSAAFWFTGIRTVRVCSARALSTHCRIHQTA